MDEYKYEIWVGETKIASDMDRENALLFVDAFFGKYYREEYLSLKIVRHVVTHEL